MSDTCPTCGSNKREVNGPLWLARHYHFGNCPDAWHDNGARASATSESPSNAAGSDDAALAQDELDNLREVLSATVARLAVAERVCEAARPFVDRARGVIQVEAIERTLTAALTAWEATR